MSLCNNKLVLKRASDWTWLVLTYRSNQSY